MTSLRRLRPIRVGTLEMAVYAEEVREVIEYREITRVPLAPEPIVGLINLRGELVAALDLGRRLGLPPRGPGSIPLNVVVERPEGSVSLLVDGAGEERDARVSPPPASLQAMLRPCVDGVVEGEPPLLVLDLGKVLDPGH